MNAPTSSPRFFLVCMSAVLICGFSSATMADETGNPMNSPSLILQTQVARLVRTSMTPSKVEITLPIGMGNTVCTEYAQVPHTGQNGIQCGYDRLVRRVCVDLPRQCHIDPKLKREVCAPQGRECHNESIDQARVCTWLESECVRTEVAESTTPKTVTLKFKKMAALGTDETETYELRGEQKRLDGSEAVFSLAAISTKGPVKINARDGLFTGFKDVITIKGE